MKHRMMTLGVLLTLVVLGALGTWRAAASGQTAAPVDLQGKWEGVLGGQLHIVLEITKLPDGSYSGKLNSVDQGAVIPMTAIRLDGSGFRFEVPAVGGVYEGEMNAAGTEITGRWTQTGVPAQPLNFRRSAAAETPTPAQPPAKAPAPKPLSAPLDTSTPVPPTAFLADGKMHLVYELHVANFSSADCWLTHLDVIAGATGDKTLASYSEADLENMLARPGQPGASPKTKLAGGTTAVIYLWLTLDKPQDVPDALRHKLSVKLGDAVLDPAITPPLAVNRKPVLVLRPPLRGDNWLAANGPSNSSVHRRAMVPVGGRVWIAQRFAIDWVRLFPDGPTFHGDRLDNKNYRAYGEEALAVADGVVTETKDGIPENVPGPASRAVPITLETVGGNHVVLDLGHGAYALYAHLQPGSLQVKPGDKVKAGQVVGLVGNSGNSTEPHLHFHICDGKSPLGCEGLPYAFPSFEMQGRGWGWKSAESKDAPQPHANEIPLENWVVRFPVAPK